ncbi:MAG: tetratricopeptide (TPR) repeat protein [Planctomycetota bacterium]|jgi:tetratricopeptide (TPR) repeat protein
MSDARDQDSAKTFLDRFWADQVAGEKKKLSDYLAQFPGHEEIIAREYLSGITENRDEELGENALEPADGQVGIYRLIKELGRGGQGVVWLAEDPRLGRKVALKVLTGMGPRSEGQLARFKREAALASKLEHPGICGVYDTGIAGGVPYIAMRFVEGQSLANRISHMRSDVATDDDEASFFSFEDDAEETIPQGSKPKPKNSASTMNRSELDRLIIVFEKIATALHAAHEVGIVHRDIKPGNIMLAENEEPVILDFGLARDDSDDSGPALTVTGDLFGTPAYMSPEQVTGRHLNLDRRSDIYSLGVTLYECVTMERPFLAPTCEALYQAIVSKEAVPARKHNRAIPSDLEVVLQCTMNKDRDKRYQSAADLAEDLRRIRANEPIAAKKVSALGRAWRWSKRRPTAAVLLLALAIGVPAVSGLGVWYWTHRDEVAAQEQAKLNDLVESQLETGFFELHHGTKKAAVAAFEEAVSLQPESVEALAGLAMAHMSLRNFESALTVITDGESATSNPGALARVKADILIKLDRKAEAHSIMETAPEHVGPLMWFVEGMRAINQGHQWGGQGQRGKDAYKLAEKCLSQAVAASPTARRAYLYQLAHARGHCETGRSESIATALKSLWPDATETWKWSSFAMIKSDLAASIQSIRKWIEIDPDSATAYYWLGIALGDQGQSEQALEAFEKALKLRPAYSNVYYKLAGVLTKLERFQEATSAYQKAIEIDPLFIEVQQDFGLFLHDQGKYEEAVAQFKHLIEKNHRDAMAHSNIGRTLNEQRKFVEAIKYLRRATELDPDLPGPHANLGAPLVNIGKLDEGIAAYRKAIELEPNHKRAHWSLGMTLFRQSKLDLAEASLRTAIKIAPEFAEAHVGLARVLRRKKQPQEAMIQVKEAIKLDPQSANAYLRMGHLYSDQGQRNDAMDAYKMAIKLRSQFVRAHYNLGKIYNDLGQPKKAIEQYTIVVKLDQNHLDAHVNLGRCYAVSGDWEKATEQFKKAIVIDPKDVENYSNLGTALARTGHIEESIQYLRQAIELDPKLAHAHYSLATILKQEGKLADAIVHYQKAIEYGHNTPRANYALGSVFETQGETAKAMAAYQDSVKLDPNFGAGYSAIGFLATQEGNRDEAIEAYEELIRVVPRNVAVYQEISSLYADQGRIAEAIKASHKGVELDPENAKLLNSLAWMLVDPETPLVHRDAKAALPLARKAVALTKRQNAYMLDTLAAAIFADGEAKGAIRVQEEAIELLRAQKTPSDRIAEFQATAERYAKALGQKDRRK